MLFTIASLVLSAVLMTQADVADIVSDVTNIEPLSEELYIFDVTSDAPVADLKGAVRSASVKVRHSFQVLGTRRYFFVVVENGSNALSQLTFPKGSLVTQYPVEHAEEFLNMLGAGGWIEEDITDGLVDKNLAVMIREFIFPEGSSTSQMKSMFQTFASAYAEAEQSAGPIIVNYAVVGRYPPKIIGFLNLDENAIQKAILDGLDTAGGPGNNVISVLRLPKV